MMQTQIRQIKYLNNIIGQDHRGNEAHPRQAAGYQCTRSIIKFVTSHYFSGSYRREKIPTTDASE